MIRNFLPSDINYVVNSHSKVYGNEYNFNASFKDFIVETTHRFIKTFDSERENLWIIEKDGQAVGSIAQHGFVLSETTEEIRSEIPMIEERWELHLNT